MCVCQKSTLRLLVPTPAPPSRESFYADASRSDPWWPSRHTSESDRGLCRDVCVCEQRVHMLGWRKAPGSVSPAACPLAREQPQQMNNSSSAVVLQARPRWLNNCPHPRHSGSCPRLGGGDGGRSGLGRLCFQKSTFCFQIGGRDDIIQELQVSLLRFLLYSSQFCWFICFLMRNNVKISYFLMMCVPQQLKHLTKNNNRQRTEQDVILVFIFSHFIYLFFFQKTFYFSFLSVVYLKKNRINKNKLEIATNNLNADCWQSF